MSRWRDCRGLLSLGCRFVYRLILMSQRTKALYSWRHIYCHVFTRLS
jgi:hypothetical protein